MSKEILTQERLKELLNYDPDTGLFVWRIRYNGSIRRNGIAGYARSDYSLIGVDGKLHTAHRLAWLFMYGVFPSGYIDHVNGVKNDNRIINLRLATNAENQFNTGIMKTNKSGVKGVFWNKQRSKWVAYGSAKGKRSYIGLFSDIDSAKIAYEAFAKQHHAEFYRQQ